MLKSVYRTSFRTFGCFRFFFDRSGVFLLAISFVALAACSGGGSGAAGVEVERIAVGDTLVVRNTLPDMLPPPAYTLEPDLTIGVEEGPEEYVLLSPQALDVDREGNIYVSDQRAGQVRVYAPDGTHRLTFGRRGEGPGEFHSQMWGLFDVHPVAGGMITVEDNPWLRIFDSDGTYLRSFDLSFVLAADERLRTSADRICWLPGREHLVANWTWRRQTGDWIMPRVTTMAVLTEDLEIVREMPSCKPPLGMYSADQRGFSLPFTAEYCHAITGDRWLAWGVSSAYRIDTFDLDSEEWLRIELDLEPVPVTAAEIDSFKASFLERYGGPDPGIWRPLLNQADYPSRKPVYAAFLGDDEGRIWVERYLPVPGPWGAGSEAGGPMNTQTGGMDVSGAEDGVAEWIRYDLFSPDGVWQGFVDSPARLNCIVGGSAYWLDYSDYPVIRRARLVP